MELLCRMMKEHSHLVPSNKYLFTWITEPQQFQVSNSSSPVVFFLETFSKSLGGLVTSRGQSICFADLVYSSGTAMCLDIVNPLGKERPYLLWQPCMDLKNRCILGHAQPTHVKSLSIPLKAIFTLYNFLGNNTSGMTLSLAHPIDWLVYSHTLQSFPMEAV
jgi:hypothetical protein